MIITRTPFRLSFFGGGTDYKAWYTRRGGLVIATALARYCYVSCRRLPPFFDYRTRIVYSQVESVRDHADINHPAVRGCLEHLAFHDGLEIHHDGDLPARSGIGSSSSFTVGLLLALHGMRHEMMSQDSLAAEAITVEQDLLKEHVGIQDQILAAHGGFRVIEMGPGPGYRVSPLLLPVDYVKALQDHVMLGFTGLTRVASTVAKAQIDSIEAGVTRLDEVFDIAREALVLFRNGGDFSALGKLLDASWHVKRDLAAGITRPEIDDIFNVARKAGAYGGKLLGAGGGGFVMLLAPPERQERIKQALSHLRVWVPSTFDDDGARVVFHRDDY